MKSTIISSYTTQNKIISESTLTKWGTLIEYENEIS